MRPKTELAVVRQTLRGRRLRRGVPLAVHGLSLAVRLALVEMQDCAESEFTTRVIRMTGCGDLAWLMRLVNRMTKDGLIVRVGDMVHIYLPALVMMEVVTYQMAKDDQPGPSPRLIPAV